MTKRMKLSFVASFLINKSNKWLELWPKFVKNYNMSPHSYIANKRTIDAGIVEKRTDVLEKIKYITKLKTGGKISLNVATQYSKSSDPQYSNKVYTIESVKSATITLTDKTQHNFKQLLKVLDNAVDLQPNVIEKARTKAKAKKARDKEGVDTDNIVKITRTRTKVIAEEPTGRSYRIKTANRKYND
jgi:hypothetical protein